VQKKTCAGFLHRTFVAYLCKFLVPETDKTDMADNKFDTNEDSLKAAEAGPPFNSHTFVRLRLLQGLICLCVSLLGRVIASFFRQIEMYQKNVQESMYYISSL